MRPSFSFVLTDNVATAKRLRREMRNFTSSVSISPDLSTVLSSNAEGCAQSEHRAAIFNFCVGMHVHAGHAGGVRVEDTNNREKWIRCGNP